MNILIAADSFKGSCSARQVTDTIERAAKNVIPDVTITKIPVADGGEGTVDALVAAMNGTKVAVPAHDPLGRPITAEYGLLPDGSAVIETAAASGLTLLKPEERDALHASTFGTGELIRHALEHRVKKIILGLGRKRHHRRRRRGWQAPLESRFSIRMGKNWNQAVST